MLRPRGNPNRKHAGKKTGKADEAFSAEEVPDGGDRSGAAEIEQIDHQQIWNAAQNRRVDVL
ncbi:hypothetical protein D3C86_2142650 [compost metagenome]